MADSNQPNLDELMKMAQKMQKSMKSAHDELVQTLIRGEAGGGIIRITMNGEHRAIRTRLEKAFTEQDIEVMEDLITAAINDASDKIKRTAQDKMVGLSKELGLPEDFKLPEGEGGDEQA